MGGNENPVNLVRKEGLFVEETMLFQTDPLQGKQSVKKILQQVYKALLEKGYNPPGQLVGYLLSGDSNFITSHRGARLLITSLDRNEILEELIVHYFHE